MRAYLLGGPRVRCLESNFDEVEWPTINRHIHSLRMHHDILIIGAGINGLLSAWFLAREGLRVGIVERGDVAKESTWAGAGVLSPLMPWDYGMAVNTLSERGRHMWPELIDQIKSTSRIDPEYIQSGMLALSVSESERALAWCRANAWRHEEAVPELEGGIADSASPLWLPDVAQVRNPRLAQALAEACVGAGVEIYPHTPVLSMEIVNDSLQAVKTSRGTLVSGAYVFCTGAWSQDVLTGLSEKLDIHPVRGQILLLKSTPGHLPFIVYKSGHYLVPRQDGLILVGSTLEQVGYDKSTTNTAKDVLQSFVLDTAPSLASAELVHHWAGLRPGSTGNIPTISPHPHIENLYLNSGHFRYGVTMAPSSAELLRDLLLGRPPSIDPAPYRWLPAPDPA